MSSNTPLYFTMAAPEVSLKSLLDLNEEYYDSKVTDVHLEKISRFLSQSIQCLAPYLGIKQRIVSDIDTLSHKEEKDKRHTFLIKWREIKGIEATYRNLIDALLTIESVEDAEEVCKLLLDHPVAPLPNSTITSINSGI